MSWFQERKNTSIMASISYSTLLISLSFNIFIFCRIGELLKEKVMFFIPNNQFAEWFFIPRFIGQCEAVGKAAYMTEWYRLPGKTGLTLVMLITMAHYPRRLTAGRIIELSISTFGNVSTRISNNFANHRVFFSNFLYFIFLSIPSCVFWDTPFLFSLDYENFIRLFKYASYHDRMTKISIAASFRFNLRW